MQCTWPWSYTGSWPHGPYEQLYVQGFMHCNHTLQASWAEQSRDRLPSRPTMLIGVSSSITCMCISLQLVCCVHTSVQCDAAVHQAVVVYQYWLRDQLVA